MKSATTAAIALVCLLGLMLIVIAEDSKALHTCMQVYSYDTCRTALR
jgi:hypothetical protein